MRSMDGDQIGRRPAQRTNAALRPTRQLRAYTAIQSAPDSTRREQRKAQISRTRARAGRSPSRATRPPGTDPGRPGRHRVPTKSAARPGPGTIARDRRGRRPIPCRVVAPVHRPPAFGSPQEPPPGSPVAINRTTPGDSHAPKTRTPRYSHDDHVKQPADEIRSERANAAARRKTTTRWDSAAPRRSTQRADPRPERRIRRKNANRTGRGSRRAGGCMPLRGPGRTDEEDRTQECGRTATTVPEEARDERLRSPRSDRSTRRTQASS